jgi:hypothetical protein
MSDLPSVLVHAHDGDSTVYCSRKEVNCVIISDDDLANGTRGTLCEIYKEAWTLNPALKAKAMALMIPAVKKRFPIMATFIPEAWINDYATEIDGKVPFDVTELVLSRGPDYMENLRDDDYPTDDLAEDVPERQAHGGPFRVEIKEAAMEFLYADENEAEEEKRKKELRKERGWATPEEKAAMEKQGHVFTSDFDHLPPKLRNQALRERGIDPATAPTAAERERARQKAAARCERAKRGAVTRKKNREAKQKASMEANQKEKTDAENTPGVDG